MTTQQKHPLMSADAFLTWIADQESGRSELLDGEVVAMAPERVAHNRTKLRLAIRLLDAVSKAGLDCQVFTDGMAIRIDDRTVFEPDASLRCGSPLADDAVIATDPVIVVEVRSPSTSRIDGSFKAAHYFRVPSIEHYLIVSASGGAHIHNRRAADGWTTRIVGPGPLRLDPPGITIDLD